MAVGGVFCRRNFVSRHWRLRLILLRRDRFWYFGKLEFGDEFLAALLRLLVEQAEGIQGFVLSRDQADDQVLD